MAEQIIDVHFGGEQINYLSLAVRGRAYHRSVDYWDGNWLLVDVSIAVGKFTGSIPGLLRAEELHNFSVQLQGFSETLTGPISFLTVEGWLKFRLEVDKLGHIRLSGTVSDDVHSPNHLTFAFNVDQPTLAGTLDQLRHVVETWPVVGSR